MSDTLKDKRNIIISFIKDYTKVHYTKRKSEQKKTFYIDRTLTKRNFNYTFIDFELIINIDKEEQFNDLFDKGFDRKAGLEGFAVTKREYNEEQQEGYITLHTYIK